MNRDFSKKHGTTGQILQKIQQAPGIIWNMHRALLEQKNTLLHCLCLQENWYLPRIWDYLCEERKKTTMFWPFGEKRKCVLTSVPVFQQLGTPILQNLSVIFKKLSWRICRQLLSNLSVATEDQEGFDLHSGKDIVSTHKTFPLNTQGFLMWIAPPLLPN